MPYQSLVCTAVVRGLYSNMLIVLKCVWLTVVYNNTIVRVVYNYVTFIVTVPCRAYHRKSIG
jgi:hypothetical protein